MHRASTRSLRAPDSGGQWWLEHQIVFSVLVLNLAPLLCPLIGDRSCRPASLEEGLGHDAVLAAVLAWVGKKHGRCFAPCYDVHIFYSVKRIYVDGLGGW